jgi:hypothetical protein
MSRIFKMMCHFYLYKSSFLSKNNVLPLNLFHIYIEIEKKFENFNK